MWMQEAKSYRIQRMPVKKKREWVREREREKENESLTLQRGGGGRRGGVMNENQENGENEMWDFRGLDRETRTRKWREHFFPPSAHHKRSFLPSFLSISVSLRLIPLVLFLKKCWTALRKNLPNIYTIKLRPCSRVRRCQPPAWAVRWKRGLFITRSIAGAAVDAFGTTVCIMLDNAREDISPPQCPRCRVPSAVQCYAKAVQL